VARYEIADGVAHKFWEITLAGRTFTVRWGRLGTRGRSQVKHFADEAEARRDYDKLVRQKRSKGYKLVDGIEESEIERPAGIAPVARSPELEAAVLADPEDEAALMVLGDWLQTQGDPRGELISLHHALVEAATDPARFLERKRAADLHYKQHEPALLGALFPLRHLFKLDWHLGYIRGAKLSLHASRDDDPDLPALLRHLVDVPSAVALRELAFGHPRSTERSYEPVIAALVDLARPRALRALSFGETWRGIDEPTLDSIGTLTGLGAIFPQLRRLVVCAPTRFGDARFPELRHLEYRDTLEGATLDWLTRCENLEYLVAGALPVERADLVPAPRVPRLRRLKVNFGAGAIDLLAQATVMPQLEGLDLGGLEPEDAEQLVARAGAFGHLKTFRVTVNIPLDDVDRDPLLRRLRNNTTADVHVHRYYPG